MAANPPRGSITIHNRRWQPEDFSGAAVAVGTFKDDAEAALLAAAARRAGFPSTWSTSRPFVISLLARSSIARLSSLEFPPMARLPCSAWPSAPSSRRPFPPASRFGRKLPSTGAMPSSSAPYPSPDDAISGRTSPPTRSRIPLTSQTMHNSTLSSRTQKSKCASGQGVGHTRGGRTRRSRTSNLARRACPAMGRHLVLVDDLVEPEIIETLRAARRKKF